jgi:hypothetical protein
VKANHELHVDASLISNGGLELYILSGGVGRVGDYGQDY